MVTSWWQGTMPDPERTLMDTPIVDKTDRIPQIPIVL